MATLRSIKTFFPAQKVNMGGIMLDQALPLRGIDQIDPVILIHHWRDTLAGNKRPDEVGVGPHPHRGFAPVTFIFEGGVHHRDSLGNSEIVEAGGTQWMHSGKGIVHSERPPKAMAEDGGLFEIIQFWVNAPSDHKMAEPYYKPVTESNTPVVTSDDGKIRVGVVAGELNGTLGPVETQSAQLMLRIDARAGGKMDLTVPKNFNALIYQLDGAATINDEVGSSPKLLTWFENDGDTVRIEAQEDTRMILLSGEPINEPLATYGPFVMNTEEELMQAMRDYQMGKMGQLIENFD